MGNLVIKDFPEEIKRKMRMEALGRGIGLRELVLEKFSGAEPRKGVNNPDSAEMPTAPTNGEEPIRESVTTGKRTRLASPKGSRQNPSGEAATCADSVSGEVGKVVETPFCDTASHANMKRSQLPLRRSP